MPTPPLGSSTTLEFFDGFDYYNTSQMGRYWTGGITPGNPYVLGSISGSYSTSAGTGRNGTASCHSYNSTTNIYLTCPAGSIATRTVGMALKVSAQEGSYAAVPYLIIFHDGVTPQVGLVLMPNGTLSVYRLATTGGLGTLILGPSSFALYQNIFYYIEMSATINSSAGAVTVRVNNAVVLTGTGLNTANTANNSSNAVSIGSAATSGAQVLDIDDFYVRADGIFCGDSRVETRLPTGNGATIQMTIGGSTLNPSNYQQVYDNPSDDDTTYVVANSAGLEDEYTYPPISTTAGTVYAVLLLPLCRNDASGSTTVEPVIRSGGTDYFGSAQAVGATGYLPYPWIQGLDPNTNAAWTIAGVNAAQYGIARTA